MSVGKEKYMSYYRTFIQCSKEHNNRLAFIFKVAGFPETFSKTLL